MQEYWKRLFFRNIPLICATGKSSTQAPAQNREKGREERKEGSWRKERKEKEKKRVLIVEKDTKLLWHTVVTRGHTRMFVPRNGLGCFVTSKRSLAWRINGLVHFSAFNALFIEQFITSFPLLLSYCLSICGFVNSSFKNPKRIIGSSYRIVFK